MNRRPRSAWSKPARDWDPAKAGATLAAQRELLGAGTTSLHLELSWPPTVNTYWRSVIIGSKVRVVISERGRLYRATVLKECVAQTQPGKRRVEGKVAVDILAHPPDKRLRDLDNLPKALLDAMQAAGVFADDADIDDLRIRRVPDESRKGTVSVTVTQLPR